MSLFFFKLTQRSVEEIGDDSPKEANIFVKKKYGILFYPQSNQMTGERREEEEEWMEKNKLPLDGAHWMSTSHKKGEKKIDK